MTKKDFELIARTIQDLDTTNAATWGANPTNRRKGERRRNSTTVAEAFAFTLQATSPRFDRDRFLRACVPGANVKARTR